MGRPAPEWTGCCLIRRDGRRRSAIPSLGSHRAFVFSKIYARIRNVAVRRHPISEQGIAGMSWAKLGHDIEGGYSIALRDITYARTSTTNCSLPPGGTARSNKPHCPSRAPIFYAMKTVDCKQGRPCLEGPISVLPSSKAPRSGLDIACLRKCKPLPIATGITCAIVNDPDLDQQIPGEGQGVQACGIADAGKPKILSNPHAKTSV